MQTWDTGRRGSATRQHVNRLTAYTLLCFALAGLVAGFTLGGFVQRSAGSTTSNIYMVMSSVPELAVNGMISAVPENIQPGYPIIRSGEDFLSPQKADGRTSYTFSTQIVYNNTSVPIQSHDVT
ncbi:MAG TPA: hypothetical protein VFV38_20555, partial [Ktedonobacteraceae bacterium]|nr:hypothetical protein [Ktedonobacteraceae bacterium]